MAMQLSSSAFKEGAIIPSEYSCDGADISPELKWQGLPANTKSLALIMADPDAPSGNFVHWVAWNIDPELKGLAADIKATATNMSQGTNSANKVGYKGPCPPSGTHRYFFKLFALDSKLNLPESTTETNLKEAMKGHILAEATLMGRYQRK